MSSTANNKIIYSDKIKVLTHSPPHFDKFIKGQQF